MINDPVAESLGCQDKGERATQRKIHVTKEDEY